MLLADDDAPFRSAMERVLRPPAFVLECHGTLDAFVTAARTRLHDVLLIDLNFRTSFGTDACTALRAEGDTRPIGIISGLVEGAFARNLASSAGASVFFEKVCPADEWRRRITWLHEGGGGSDHRPPPTRSGVHVHLLDQLDAAASIELRDGTAVLREYRVGLRPQEYEILERLLAELGTVVSIEDLIVAVWKEAPSPNAEFGRAQRARVATGINRLRHALGDAAEMIESVPGGYRVRSARARSSGE